MEFFLPVSSIYFRTAAGQTSCPCGGTRGSATQLCASPRGLVPVGCSFVYEKGGWQLLSGSSNICALQPRRPPGRRGRRGRGLKFEFKSVKMLAKGNEKSTRIATLFGIILSKKFDLWRLEGFESQAC